MKTVIIYASVHHGNTKKLAEQLAEKYGIVLIDAVKTREADLSEYDLIGFASGIYFGKFHKMAEQFAQKNLPQGKKVFLLYTHGALQVGCPASMKKILEEKNSAAVGFFGCRGYDTFGPFRLVGGLAKGHPNERDLTAVQAFYESLLKEECRQ